MIINTPVFFSIVIAIPGTTAVVVLSVDQRLGHHLQDNQSPSDQSHGDSHHPGALVLFILVVLTVVVLMPMIANFMQHVLCRYRNKNGYMQCFIIWLMLSNMAPTIPGITALIFGYVFNHLEFGVLGFGLLQALYSRPVATWNSNKRLFFLLRRIPPPSLTSAASELTWATTINNLINDATSETPSSPPCFEDTVVLSSIYLKSLSFDQYHFGAALSAEDGSECFSFEHKLLSFLEACSDYDSNVGTWLRDRFSRRYRQLVAVPSVAGTSSISSDSSREAHGKEQNSGCGSNPNTERAPVNDVGSLRILFTIVMYQCITNSCDADDKVARYWKVMNQDLTTSEYLTWFIEFTKRYCTRIDNV